MSLSTLNPVEPPWYVTRMPGGVGGMVPRGVPYPDRGASPVDARGERERQGSADGSHRSTANIGTPRIPREGLAEAHF